MIVSIAFRWDLRPIFSIPTSTLMGKFVWSCLIISTGFLQLRSLKVSIYCTPETFFRRIKNVFLLSFGGNQWLAATAQFRWPVHCRDCQFAQEQSQRVQPARQKVHQALRYWRGQKFKKPKAKKSKPTP